MAKRLGNPRQSGAKRGKAGQHKAAQGEEGQSRPGHDEEGQCRVASTAALCKAAKISQGSARQGGTGYGSQGRQCE